MTRSQSDAERFEPPIRLPGETFSEWAKRAYQTNDRATKPRFAQTYCSQCGRECGPGNAGVSSCGDHS
jgi:hypothetical protein